MSVPGVEQFEAHSPIISLQLPMRSSVRLQQLEFPIMFRSGSAGPSPVTGESSLLDQRRKSLPMAAMWSVTPSNRLLRSWGRVLAPHVLPPSFLCFCCASSLLPQTLPSLLLFSLLHVGLSCISSVLHVSGGWVAAGMWVASSGLAQSMGDQQQQSRAYLLNQ